MKMKHTIVYFIFSLLGLISLAACNGGGGSAADASLVPAPSIPVWNFSPQELLECYTAPLEGEYNDGAGFDITFNDDCTGYMNGCQNVFVYKVDQNAFSVDIQILSTTSTDPACPAVGEYRGYQWDAHGNSPVKLDLNFPIIRTDIPALVWNGVPQ